MAPHSIALLILLSNGDATISHMDDTLMVDTLDIEAYLYLHRFAYRTAHGKGTETRSQTRGAGERRRTQSAPPGHLRRLVHRQSLPRSKASASGALRDGATASRRCRRNQRGLD